MTDPTTTPRPGQHLDELDTPAVLIDLDRVEANIARMHARVRSNGVGMRCHIKTHKSPAVAELQRAAGFVGIAVAKIGEAEVFVAAGHDDVVFAYPVTGAAKWRRGAQLARSATITVHVENPVAVAGWQQAAADCGVTLRARLEIDTGFHRCGVLPEEAAELAAAVAAAPNLDLDGITTHRSAFFPDHGGRPAEELGHEEGRLMVQVADSLRADGYEIRNVLGGSTPTAGPVSDIPGITESCAGTYVFYDEGMAEIGVCRRDDIAISMQATVVSVRDRRVTVDGGSKTFCKDSYFPGSTVYGRAMTGEGYLSAVTEEHGMLHLGDDDPTPKVGDRVRIHPMHVCPTVNLTDTLVAHRGDVVEDVFAVAARGRTR